MSHFQILIKIDSAIWASLLNDDSKDFKMTNTETTGGLHLDPGTWILGTGITSRQHCKLTEILSLFEIPNFQPTALSYFQPCHATMPVSIQGLVLPFPILMYFDSVLVILKSLESSFSRAAQMAESTFINI